MSREYPAFRYRKTDHHTVVVLNIDEDTKLGDDWLATLPEGFDVHQKMPTYPNVDLVVNPVDIEKLAAELDEKPRAKPGPKPKAKD